MNLLPSPIVHAQRGPLPVLLSVPHAGRAYPAWLLDLARRGQASLRALEDPLVDRLVWRALARGAGAVIAVAPRAAVDCNRAEDEIDPTLIHPLGGARATARARGGLGVVPSRTAAHGSLWNRPLSRAELDRRLDEGHRPYHRAIAEQLALIADRFGCALLLDCHSMPSSKGTPQMVFGDRHGRSAAPWVMAEALAIAAEAGFSASANDPFAGGHVLDRHGSPAEGVHAIQLEIDRGCYLAQDGKPGPGFDEIAAFVELLAARLGTALLDRRMPAAAE
ncbi:MAG: N-formylglutamate amidohydrolase [Alphaproteobacteria bacterium]